MTTSKEEPELPAGKLILPEGKEIPIPASCAILILFDDGNVATFAPKWINMPGVPDDYLPPQVQALFFAIMLLSQPQFEGLYNQLEPMVKNFYQYFKNKEGNVQHAIH